MDYLSRGLRNSCPSFFRQAESANESDTKVDSSESDIEDLSRPAADPLIPPFLDEKGLMRLLVRGDPAAKKEFVEYYMWCLKEIEGMDKGGDDFLEFLIKMERKDEEEGKFNSTFTDWMERHFVNKCIKSADDWSRSEREKWSLWNRRRRGIGEGGNPPEKSKDLFSTALQTGAYPFWSVLQWLRTITGAIVYHGQARGVYPIPEQARCALAVDGTYVNGTVFDGVKVEGNLVNGHLVNGTLFNTTYVNGGYFNGSYFNGTSFDSTNACGLTINGTAIDGAAAGDRGSAPLDNPKFYEGVAWTQFALTVATEFPYLVHAIPQFRQYAREKAEQNKAHDAALACLRKAIEYMTKESPKADAANAYVLAMQNWRRQGSKVGQHDVDLRLYSSYRELAFLVNLHFTMATSANLVSGQTLFRTYHANNEVNRPVTARIAGSIQAIGGMFGLAQYSLDIAQGWSELAGATEKLRKIRESIKNLKKPAEAYLQSSDGVKPDKAAHEFFTAKVANSAALSYQTRQEPIERWEQWGAGVRMLKGWVGLFTGGASFYYGMKQITELAKSPLEALVWSLASTYVSAWYYKSSYLKMRMRENEKVLKKQLYQEAQFIKLNHPLKDLGGKLMAGTVAGNIMAHNSVDYIDYRHLFQKGKMGVKFTREAKYAENEYLLLDLLTDHILDELNEKTVEQTLQLPLVRWLDATWNVPLCELTALLEFCSDKAPLFRAETFRDVLAKQLRIVPQIGKDGKEKKVKPSVLVMAKIMLFEPLQSDYGMSFWRIASDYKETSAASIWDSKPARADLLHATTLEELISSVTHIHKQSSMPVDVDDLLDDHIKFAKLLGVVQHAAESRAKGLAAVANATLETWQFPQKAKQKIDVPNLDAMNQLVKDYAAVPISDRGEQTRALKKLANNKIMQIILGLTKYTNWRRRLEERDKDLFVGFELLTDRVDRNQPLFQDVINSPRRTNTVPESSTATDLRSVLVEGEEYVGRNQQQSHDYTASSSADEADRIQKKRARRGNRNGRSKNSPQTSTGKQQKAGSGPKRPVYDNDGNDSDNKPKPESAEISSTSSNESSTTSNKTTTSGPRSGTGSPRATKKTGDRRGPGGQQSASPDSLAAKGSPTKQKLSATPKSDRTVQTLAEAEKSDSVISTDDSQESSFSSSYFSDDS